MTVRLIVLTLAAFASASNSSELRQPIRTGIPILPSPVKSDGHSTLVFEVHITNFDNEPVEPHLVTILDAADGHELARFAGVALVNRTKIIGANANLPPAQITAGGTAIVYVEIDLRAHHSLRALKIEVECSTRDGRRTISRSGAILLDRTPAPILEPPLKDGTWVAVHDPSWERGHRRVSYSIGGSARVPGRYAVDWVGVDEGGRTSKGEPDIPADAIGYGAPVLAGANSTVVAIRDDMQESPSIKAAPRHRPEDGSGNYVVLRLSSNRFAFYEHLRPGSVRVRAGDHVRAGQVIGALGFTGDSTGPHLHLHVADCSSLLECEGVPFVVRGMTEVGRYDLLSDLGGKRWRDADARGALKPEWPGYNVVVRFSK